MEFDLYFRCQELKLVCQTIEDEGVLYLGEGRVSM